ncbi:hypothetical protein RchiOBHm_Chr3g0488391 [Rosa chinensis]|uniref:Uncharacterized protein n=1 Tax=Rosa chinensis TaxID=74649 RepID=A0A2P6RFT8_ROSCH|nr:hypothetical protein RchiOBHm_Chr3g0488391 [Rosa chinensis]
MKNFNPASLLAGSSIRQLLVVAMGTESSLPSSMRGLAISTGMVTYPTLLISSSSAVGVGISIAGFKSNTFC